MLPSTTIGNTYDEFIRDFFRGVFLFENGKVTFKENPNYLLSDFYKNVSE